MSLVLRAQNLVRHVTNDAGIRVRFGAETMYVRQQHVVEIDEKAASYGDDVFLALAGHEGSHAVLSRYLEVPRVRKLPSDEVGLLNWFEDQRVNNWLADNLPGLRGAVAMLDDIALGYMESKLGGDLGFTGRKLPPHVLFMRELRSRVVDRVARPASEPIEGAIRECLADTRAACAEFPSDWRPEESEVRAAADLFLLVMEERVLPWYRKLKAEAERGANGTAGAKLRELERRMGDPARGPWSGRAWQALRSTRQSEEAATGVGRRAFSPWRYESAWREVSQLVDRFVGRLDDALVVNRAGGQFQYGYPAGDRVDLRQLMQLGHDPSRAMKIWGRRIPPDDREWRLLIAADTSQSMFGERLEALQRVVVLLLEAAERLGLPNGLILFGQSATRGRPGVVVAKEMSQPLAAARPRIGDRLFGYNLGDETPLAQALDRCRHVLGEPEANRDDLVLVVTDGRPCWSEERYCDVATETNCVGDDGKPTGEKVQVQGRSFFWRSQWSCAVDVKAALRKLVADGARHVVGVGIGEHARVHEWFPTAVQYADAEAFAASFPKYVGRWLERALVRAE